VQFGPNTADHVQYTYTATGRKVRKQTSHQNAAQNRALDYGGISHCIRNDRDFLQ